ncbi:MAG: ABC transporter ATP-binding protein [Myxococcales bacterium]|nr:ABC transporter ATP-binding protein [Myxococcales bacterium]
MITVKNLWYTYPKSKEPTLKGLDFHIDDGEIFGFLGPSASGKSTTQKLLIGLLKGYKGEVSILGKDAKSWGSDLYQDLGVGFELPNHFLQLTGLENLKLFSSFYKKETRDPMELLKLVGLEEAADQRVKNYSKGMMVRLNFVRAILHDPKLLFLDEPTSGLDPTNAKKLREIILKLKKEGKTIFLTTHNMHIADELCDRVAFIVEGKIALVDSPRALKLSHGELQVRVEYRKDGALVQEDFPLHGLGKEEGFRALLDADELETIHSREATLEDVFIKETGRSLR